MTSVPDGNLPAALDRLYIAIATLIDPIKEMHDGVIVSADSLYDQLLGAWPPGRFRRYGQMRWICGSKLMTPPVDGNAISRPRRPGSGRWPRDRGDHKTSTFVEHIAGYVESWAVSVKSLLSPTGIKHVSAPCPACGATSVFRRDSAGEVVRAPALQIVTELGCTCQACRYTWSPDYYLHLAKVSGLDAPAGVIG